MPEPIKQQIIKQIEEEDDSVNNLQYGSVEFVVINGKVDRVEVHRSRKVKTG